MPQSTRHNNMKRKPTGRRTNKVATDWNRIATATDHQIRQAIRTDPDVAPTDAAFWKGARVVRPKPK
jgi:hypothetical protein